MLFCVFIAFHCIFSEYGDDWQVNIQDAILEKCEGNDGVRHIAIDTSNNEVCVIKKLFIDS